MKDNISVIGIGKLGLCFSLTLERAGYNVLGVDISPEYVKLINEKSLSSDEEGVTETLRSSKNFRATTDVKEAIEFSDFLYVLVATPSLPNGEYDHSQIEGVVEQLMAAGRRDSLKHLIIGCTTMPEYCRGLQSRLEAYNYEVSYNPEFIAQGTILRDQLKPSQVLIGSRSGDTSDLIKSHYEKMTENDPVFCLMSPTEAEICKLVTNCFLTTKISFANMVGDICVRAGVDPDRVLKGVGSDFRISPKYLGYGYGFGGPCFPRDNRAVATYALSKGVDAFISKASDDMNKAHIVNQLNDFIANNPDKSQEVFFGPVTYKPESTMIEESQQLKFAVMVARAGYKVTIQERRSVIQEVQSIYGNLFSYRVIGSALIKKVEDLAFQDLIKSE